MEKIVVFGASLGGQRALRSLGRNRTVIAVCDNDVAKHGTRFHGYPVIAPSALESVPYDRILIASSYYTEIFEQLVQQGVSMDQIDILENSVLLGSDRRPRRRYWRWMTRGVVWGLALYGLYRLIFG